MEPSATSSSASPAPPAGGPSQPFLSHPQQQSSAGPDSHFQQPHLPSPGDISPGLAPAPLPGTAAPTSLLPAHSIGSDPTSSASPASSQQQPQRQTRSSAKGADGGPAGGSAPTLVAFDPNADGGSDDDDDAEEGASPKKKARKASSRSAVAGAGASGSAAGSGAEGAGGAADDDKARRKIEIEYIQKKEKRHITFSKRKAGIMKKAYELATLTGTQVLLLVVSETGIVYTFTTTKFQPLVGANPDGTPSDGQRLIQRCLAGDPDEEKNSDYISPPPDGPLLPLPPSAQKRPFEANSQQHGGQIALRTKQQRPRNKARPAPIVPPAPSGGQSSLPTPGIHATMDQMQGQPVPPSPHRVHPLNPAPPGSLGNYPPSPGYAPRHPQDGGELPSPMRPGRDYGEMMDRANVNGQYGPPPSYPPPPALGYTHQMQPNRPPHPLDPYPHPHMHSHGSPSSSPRQARHLPPPPPHGHYASSAPRSLGPDPYGSDAHAHAHYGGPPSHQPTVSAGGEDLHMLSPQHQHLPPPPPHLSHALATSGPPPPGLPQPPPELYLQHAHPHQGDGYDGQDTYMRR
ncbi:uncharacterized protein JCM10292_001576 [Rhodotorula paludigena]|uniref:uncharacterized protein n=1 Tax=Rhodotorula paludigena TaxID=86838 RepID=UPI003174C50F